MKKKLCCLQTVFLALVIFFQPILFDFTVYAESNKDDKTSSNSSKTTSFVTKTASTKNKTDGTNNKIVDNVMPDKISVNFKNTDLRDALSAVAVNMELNIVYLGKPQSITFEANNISPWDAFEYMLKASDMSYLRKDKSLIIGTREMIANFPSKLAITRIPLNYITSEIITEKIQQLNIPVTIITVETNSKAIWVQGTAYDFTKVRELINLLDIQENAVDLNSEDKNAKRKNLIAIQLKFLTPEEFNAILQSIGISNAVSFSDSTKKAYIYATDDEWKTINKIKEKIDKNDMYSIISSGKDSEGKSEKQFEILNLRHANKADIIELIETTCDDVQVIYANGMQNVGKTASFMVVGTTEAINKAKSLVSKLDTVENAFSLESTYFSYDFNNLTSAEALNRLENMVFEENVSFYVTENAQLNRTIFGYAPKPYISEIKTLLASMDVQLSKSFKIPVFTSSVAVDAQNVYDILRTFLPNEYLSNLHGPITVGGLSFVYVENADASVLKLVEELLSRVSYSSPDSAIKASDLVYSKYTEECAKSGVTPTPEGYAMWVQEKLGGMKTSGFSLPSNNSQGDYLPNKNMLEQAKNVITQELIKYIPPTSLSISEIYNDIVATAAVTYATNPYVSYEESEKVRITGQLISSQEPTMQADGYIDVKIIISDINNQYQPIQEMFNYTLPKLTTAVPTPTPDPIPTPSQPIVSQPTVSEPTSSEPTSSETTSSETTSSETTSSEITGSGSMSLLDKAIEIISNDFIGYQPIGYTSIENLANIIFEKAKASVFNNSSLTDLERTGITIEISDIKGEMQTADTAGNIEVTLTVKSGKDSTTKILKFTLNAETIINTQEINP